MSRYPRWLQAEVLSALHDDELSLYPPPTPSGRPDATKEQPMKTCTKCGKPLRGDNSKGICGQASACRARVEALANGVLVSEKPKEPVNHPPSGETWLTKFNRLHEALGLDPAEAIESHCRTWVEATTSRALGQPAKPVKLHSRRAETAEGQQDAAAGAEG